MRLWYVQVDRIFVVGDISVNITQVVQPDERLGESKDGSSMPLSLRRVDAFIEEPSTTRNTGKHSMCGFCAQWCGRVYPPQFQAAAVVTQPSAAVAIAQLLEAALRVASPYYQAPRVVLPSEVRPCFGSPVRRWLQLPQRRRLP